MVGAVVLYRSFDVGWTDTSSGLLEVGALWQGDFPAAVHSGLDDVSQPCVRPRSVPEFFIFHFARKGLTGDHPSLLN